MNLSELTEKKVTMRIIYEDGSYREEREKAEQAQNEKQFTDISSMSEEYKKSIEAENAPSGPYRPAPTLRPEAKETAAVNQSPAVNSDTTVAAVQPQMSGANPNMNVLVNPYGGQQGYYYGYPQGYPVQYAQHPQYQQYPQGYPYPAQYPVTPQQMAAYQQPQMPAQAPIQVQTPHPQTAQTPANNPSGTRVIYQSPDFDNYEAAKANMAQPAARPFTSISQEEVTVSAVPTAQPIVKPLPDKSFRVDDMEMSIFELNAMAHKYHAKSKAYKNPAQRSGSLEIEDCEEEALPQPKTQPEFFADADDDETEETVKKTEKPQKKKSKKKKRKEIIRRTVLAISIIAILVSAGFLVNEYRLSKMNAETAEETNDLVIDVDNIFEEYQQEHYEELTEPDGTVHELTEEEKQAIIDKEWEKIKKEYPNVTFPENLQLEYARLYAENQDFVGFLKADGIGMSLPIVQTSNDEYYLKKDFYKRNTKYGTPFVTHLNNIPEQEHDKYNLDRNTVIFGHHMNDGSVFGILDQYKTIEGFKKAPVITFNTKYHNYQWKVIAAFVTNAEAEDDNGYVFRYYYTDLEDEARFDAYIQALKERSLYDTGVDVRSGDRLLTLSTCSHEFDNARFVVVARLVRIGEVPEVDVSKATVNSNPRYPQAYYDKKKKENPYKDAYRWEYG